MIVRPEVIEAFVGDDVSFACTVEPEVLLEVVAISWIRRDHGDRGRDSSSLTSMRTLSLTNVRLGDEGNYVCVGSRGDSTSEAVGILKIRG